VRCIGRVLLQVFGNSLYHYLVSEAEPDRARRLPPGPHGLPPELVERNQRERLIAAMAEVCGEGGYSTATVAEVARRAGVSTASFYRQFKDRRECMLASFEELLGRLLGEVERGCEGEDEPEARVRRGVETAAALLAADPPTTRLLSIEVAAVGPEGVQLQHDAIERLAALLREARAPGGAPPASFPTPEWAAVAAMVALVARRAAEGGSPESGELEALCDLLESP
jgi:AcrR family transcriptional regulator